MKVRIDTMPVDALPQNILLNTARIIRVTYNVNNSTIQLLDETEHRFTELADLLLDIVWCYNPVEETLVVGSEDGHHVYFIGTKDLQVKQVLHILREEDRSLSRFVILVTPDERHVAILSELVFAIAKWTGEVVLDYRINMLQDKFLSLTNNSISFEDQSDEKKITYYF
jgi:hypothetical protein